MSASKSRCEDICKLVAIVVDHGLAFLEPSGSKLEFDTGLKPRSSNSGVAVLNKTTWTCVVEGVIEYVRIVYDLFPSTYKVCVTCSDQAVWKINSFADDLQSIQQVIKGFGELGPPSMETSAASSVYPGVAASVEALLEVESSPESSGAVGRRLIIITSFENEHDSKTISNAVWEILSDYKKSRLSHLDVVVVNISNSNEIVHSKRQVSQYLDVTALTFKSWHCSEKIASLAKKHYDLRSTIVTGIPMKEEQNAGSSANYDVEIVHSAGAHHEAEWTNPELSGIEETKDPTLKNFLVLRWCTPKAAAGHELQPCVGLYKMTPAEVNSRPAACLVTFLLQGRSVMLEQPKKSGMKVLSHMLSSHGGDLYIHVLAYGKSPMEDPPSISEGPGGRVTDYRINDFGRFMKENRLAPYPKPKGNEEGPNEKAKMRLGRFSKHWPMAISETLMFNMQQELDPLLSLMIRPKLSEEDVQQCKKVIYKLQAMESRSDTLPLPMITLRGKGSRKEDQYKQLWSEIDQYLEGASTTSPAHKKVLDCLRGTIEDDAGTTKMDTAEDSALKEYDRYQSMTETEKKAFNSRQPSDPRRRRRTSDPVTTKSDGQEEHQQPVSPKAVMKHRTKAPLEESPTKKKVSRANVMLSLAPTIQPKASLLAIWSSQASLNASRLHEEFEGRKNSVNGKYELYQEQNKEPSPSGQTDPRTTVKDWV